MVRIFSLIWTLILSLLVTAISFFYIREEKVGFPFSFATDTEGQGFAGTGIEINFWSLILDIIFWWFLFSILWLILKNYVFDL